MIERLDERLHYRYRPIEGTDIAPSLQIMSLRQVPVALARRFILVEAQVHAKSNFLHSLNESQIRGGCECRIAPQNDEHLDVPVRHVVHQLGKRLDLMHGFCGIRSRVDYCPADIAEAIIDRMRE